MFNCEQWTWLYLVCFLDFLGASMIMPVFGSHLRSLGISHAHLGLLSSCYGTIQLVSGPIVGSWSDVSGRRYILSLCIVLSSIAYGLTGIISSFYLMFIIRCVLGIFKHTQTLCRAFVADIVPLEKQASVQGLMNAFTSFSFMIGPVIGGHVMEIENGFQYLTRLVFIIFILNALVVIFSNKITNINKGNLNKKQDSFLSKLLLVFKELYFIDWKSFWPLFCVKFLSGLAGSIFFQNLGVILSDNFEASPKYMGYTIAFFGFLSGFCGLSVGKFKSLKILPEKHITSLIYTNTFLAATFLFLYMALFLHSYAMFVVGLIPLATCHALTRIFITEVLLEKSDVSYRGSVMGASSSVTSLARILGPLLSGIVISWHGTPTAMIVSSVTAATAGLLTKFYSSQMLEHDKKD